MLTTPNAASVDLSAAFVTVVGIDRAIETAAAAATVAALGVDAIWIAPTSIGAELRASLCLSKGVAPALVTEALERWSA